jgi:hypothetical protein
MIETIPQENDPLTNRVMEAKQHIALLLEFCLVKATSNNPEADKYQQCYEQLETNGKISWDSIPHDFFSDLNKYPGADATLGYREITMAAFFDNEPTGFDPLYYLTKEISYNYNKELLDAYKEDRSNPTTKFVTLFIQEFIKTINLSTDPHTIQNTYYKQFMDAIHSGNPIIGYTNGEIRDKFVMLCQRYRFERNFIDQLENKLGWFGTG